MFYVKLFLMCLWAFTGCLIGLLISPLLRFSSERFGIGMKIVAWGALKIAGIKVIIEDKHFLEADQPCLYFGNHQSAFDAVTFAFIMPRHTTAVAKSDVRWVPVLGWWYAAVGGSFITRQKREKAIEELTRFGERLQTEGLSVAMMPEGTRNRKGYGLLPFKKGPFHLAVLAQVPIVPVISSPLAHLANFDNKVIRPGTVIIRGYPAIPTRGLTIDDIDSLMEKVHRLMEKYVLEMEGVVGFVRPKEN